MKRHPRPPFGRRVGSAQLIGTPAPSATTRFRERVAADMLEAAERHRPDFTETLDARTLFQVRTFTFLTIASGERLAIHDALAYCADGLEQSAHRDLADDTDVNAHPALREKASNLIVHLRALVEARPADQRAYAASVSPYVTQGVARIAAEALVDALRSPDGEAATIINAYAELCSWRDISLSARDGELFARVQNLTPDSRAALSSVAVNLKNASDAISSIRNRPRVVPHTISAARSVLNTRIPARSGRTHHGTRGDRACRHERTEWHEVASVRSVDSDTLVLCCFECGLDRLACVPLHRAPTDHDAYIHVKQRASDYLRVEGLHRELRGEAPLDTQATIADLRAADGIADLDEIAEAALAVWHGERAHPNKDAPAPRTMREIMQRR